jgi:hypothetical protein
VRFVQRYGLNVQSNMPTISIVAPNGNPVGYVAPRAGANMRTLRTQREMEVMIARLLHNARLLSRPNSNGSVYMRPDGTTVVIRNSHRNGFTVDFSFPNMREPPTKKLHVFMGGRKSTTSYMEIKSMADIYPYPATKNINITKFFTDKKLYGMNFADFCAQQVEDTAIAEAEDLSFFQLQFGYCFEHDPNQMELAMRYFLSYIMSRGYAPMNFANARAPNSEYGPITKYGLRPQEIIDNIVADWRSRNYEPFEPYEVMFGWEQNCGLFMEEDQ